MGGQKNTGTFDNTLSVTLYLQDLLTIKILSNLSTPTSDYSDFFQFFWHFLFSTWVNDPEAWPLGHVASGHLEKQLVDMVAWQQPEPNWQVFLAQATSTQLNGHVDLDSLQSAGARAQASSPVETPPQQEDRS